MVVRAASGTLGGVSMKHLSLVTLTFQNSALILVRPPFMADDNPCASKKRTQDANSV
ncbi:hypothetical protein AA0118_g4087 [Alternaria tenuissima]|nr:hypothetical protein AA0118_g4087 [Alternaria tenuissima]RYN91854.1 hypothetical protein AA0120_g5395 [Alternaria tenuissima]